MIRLSDKVRLIFALLGVSSILVSMYLIPFIKTENKFWEILLFILGVSLIGIELLNHNLRLPGSGDSLASASRVVYVCNPSTLGD